MVYFVRDELLIIVAVAHAMRRPAYWRDRGGQIDCYQFPFGTKSDTPGWSRSRTGA